MIIWWSKHVGVILSVSVYDIWINVLLQTSALVEPLYIVNWNARGNSENLNVFSFWFDPAFCQPARYITGHKVRRKLASSVVAYSWR
jgi:hypothetical protein